MTPFIELFNAALKQGVTYGVFFILFCTAALIADSQDHIDLAALGPGARTTVALGLLAAFIVVGISIARRCAAFLWPKAVAFEQSRRVRRARKEALAVADAEVFANVEILPKHEKLLLALVMHKGSQRFTMVHRSDEFYGLFSKGIIHLPANATGKRVFLVRDNVWAQREAFLEEQEGAVHQHLLDLKKPTHVQDGGWVSGLELQPGTDVVRSP